MWEQIKGFRWSSLPPLYKQRTKMAVALYVLFLLLIAGLIGIKGHDAMTRWQENTPTVTATIGKKSFGIQSSANDTTTATVPASGSRGAVSLIVSGLGLSQKATHFAIQNLPRNITLAFSPYARDLSEALEKAAEYKHETLMLLPMEGDNYPVSDPGPKTLLLNVRDSQNTENLYSVLNMSKQSVGVMNYRGSRFMTDDSKMQSLFQTLKSRNLFFIENAADLDKPQSETIAQIVGIPYIHSQLVLDNPPTVENILAQFRELERTASVKGHAIGIIHAFPASLEALENWVSTLDSRGIQLVPLTALVKNNNKKTEQKQ